MMSTDFKDESSSVPSKQNNIGDAIASVLESAKT